MNNTVVRELRLNDYEGVREVDDLTQRVYRGIKWDKLSEKKKDEFMTSRKGEFKLNCKTKFSFIAIRNHKVVGFLLAHETLPFKDKIFIRHIAVHPDFQKQGIGKRLYGALINKARIKNKIKIEALINLDNPPSIKLHKEVGFKVVTWARAIFKLL
jgi:L-amino acid N-acyltransferase YncA